MTGTPRISIIAAVAENGVIGRDGGLPWRLRDDLRRFKALTTGRVVIMGRRTFESIGRPLPDRTTIVITRQPDYQSPGARVAGSLEAALELARRDPRGGEEVFVIGGAAIYRESLPLAGRIYLTRVHAEVGGDVRFPEWTPEHWRLVRRQEHAADERNDFGTTFEIWERAGRTPTA